MRQADRPARGPMAFDRFLLAAPLATFGFGIPLASLSVALPALQGEWHIGLGEAGLLMASSRLGSMTGCSLAGRAIGERPGRLVGLGSLALVSLGWLLFALAPTFPAALAAIFLSGFGGGAHFALMLTGLARMGGARHTALVGMVVTFSFAVGSFGGPLLAAGLHQVSGSYRALYGLVALFMLLPLSLYVRARLPAPAAAPAGARAVPRALWGRAALCAALCLLYLGIEVSFALWGYTATRLAGAGGGVLGGALVPSAFYGAILVSVALCARRGWQDPRQVAWGGLAGALAMAAILAGGATLAVDVVAAAALGAAVGPIYPIALARAARLYPPAAARLSALVTGSAQVGAAAIPVLQGLALAGNPRLGMGVDLAACALLGLAGAAAVRVLGPDGPGTAA